jgi:urease accessory protein
MKALTLAIVVVVAMTGAASAHSVYGITGFAGGLLHPLVVPAHILAVAALALLIGQQGWPYRVPVAYFVFVLAGLGAIALAYVPAAAELSLLGLAALAGVLLALARPMPVVLGIVVAAAIGLAQALDSPPEAISLTDANLALAGTAMGSAVLLTVLTWLASRLRREWQRIGVRIVGSWLAASAILVLVLRIAP